MDLDSLQKAMYEYGCTNHPQLKIQHPTSYLGYHGLDIPQQR